MSDLQESDNENTRQADLLGTGDGKLPDSVHRHEQNHCVCNNVWDLESIVKFSHVQAASGYHRVPQLLGRDAGEAAHQDTTKGP